MRETSGVEEFAVLRRVGGGTDPGRLSESAHSGDLFVPNESTAIRWAQTAGIRAPLRWVALVPPP